MGKEENGVYNRGANESGLSCWDRKCTQFIINRVTSFLPKSAVGAKFEKTFNTEQNW